MPDTNENTHTDHVLLAKEDPYSKKIGVGKHGKEISLADKPLPPPPSSSPISPPPISPPPISPPIPPPPPQTAAVPAKSLSSAVSWARVRSALHEINKAPIFLVNGALAVATLGGVPRKWPLKDRSRWIEELAQDKPQLRLFEAAIPGTHNSATYRYESFGKPYNVCQNCTILDQLRGGVRFIDLCVCDDAGFDEHLWVSCTLLCQRLESQLCQIREFLDERPHEIVLLYIKRDCNRHFSPRGSERLDAFVRSQFEGRLIMQSEIENFPIADLIQTGRQLVLLDDDLGLPCNPDPPRIRSSWSATHDDNPRRLVAQLRGWASDTAPALPPIISNLEVIVTPTVRSILPRAYKSLHSWAKDLHKIVLAPGGLLDDLKAIPNPRRINVISFDYATDEMIAAIISLNNLEAQKEAPIPPLSRVRSSGHVGWSSTSSSAVASIKKNRCWPHLSRC